MDVILGFLAANWISVVLVVGFIVMCFIMIKKGYERNVRLMILSLVCKMENIYGTGTGSIKFEAEVSEFMEHAPSIVKFLFTADEIDNFIEDCVEILKNKLQPK